jgi:hypothetical protein
LISARETDVARTPSANVVGLLHAEQLIAKLKSIKERL